MKFLPVCFALLAPATGFLLAGPKLPVVRTRSHQVVVHSAAAGAQGFRLTYGDADSPYLMDTLRQRQMWEQEYQAYLKRNGKHICALSWKGFESYGRGAIFAKYDDFGGRASEMDQHSAVPSMYVELARWEESMREPSQSGDLANLQQIIDRVRSYDPQKQFVVVFQSHGLMGTDVVTPNIWPREMATLMAKEEEAKARVIDVQAAQE